ncbi:hypothetical protein V2J09_018418 [Rumex salicifolius]
MSSSSERERGGTCQDCGNKAKRECQHLRCRTCCKTRGFVCPTHVRSTWVPISLRRHNHQHHRLSLHLHAPNFPSSSGLVAGRDYRSFPPETSTLANFRQVRVNSGDNEVNEVAYQASTMIGGHLFKGILYDQGPCSAFPGGGGGVDSSSADHHYQLAGMTEAGESSGGYVNPNYPHHHHGYNFSHGSSSNVQPFNASLLPPGMQFFPNPKP